MLRLKNVFKNVFNKICHQANIKLVRERVTRGQCLNRDAGWASGTSSPQRTAVDL